MKFEELKMLRSRAAKKFDEKTKGANGAEWRIVVSMGTAGILHGARDILKTFIEKVNELELKNVVVAQSSSFGLHTIEPACWIHRCGEEKVVYGRLKPGMIRDLLAAHIVEGAVLNAYRVVMPTSSDVAGASAN